MTRIYMIGGGVVLGLALVSNLAVVGMMIEGDDGWHDEDHGAAGHHMIDRRDRRDWEDGEDREDGDPARRDRDEGWADWPHDWPRGWHRDWPRD